MKNNLIFLFLFFSVVAIAQQPISVHLTENDGLPDNEFYSVLEDNEGFLWLGAGKGLHRYDGKEYKLFSHPEQVGLSAFSIVKDDDNVIWYTNLANQLFFIKDEKVELFDTYKDLFSGVLFDITVHKNILILSINWSITIIDRKTKKVLFTQKKTPINLYSYPYFRNDSILFTGELGERIHLNEDFDFKIKKNTNNNLYKESTRRGSILFIDNKMFFVRRKTSTDTDIYIVKNIDNNILFKLEAKIYKTVVNGIEVVDNTIFLLTSKGVQVYSCQNDTLHLSKKYLINKNVTDVVKDKENNYWFTTLNNGIHVMPNLSLINHKKLRGENSIEKVFEGKKNEIILKGNNDSVYVFNAQNQKIKRYSSKNLKRFEYLFYNKKRDVYYVHNSRLSKLSFNSEILQTSNPFVVPVLKSHYYKNDDEVFFSTSSQVYLFNLNYKNKKEFNFPLNEHYRGYSCFYDKETFKSYFGTIKGFFVYDVAYNKKEIFFENQSIYIKQIIQTDDQRIWALSFKNGLYQIKNDTIIAHYNIDNGLLSNINTSITAHDNFLWIIGQKGLQQLSIGKEKFKNLTKINGIPSYNFTFLKYSDGRLYVATKQDLFSFDTNTIFKSEKYTIPKPYFTEIYVNEILKKSNVKTLNLDEGNNLNINFNVNGFLSGENTTYQYRLIDNIQKNKDWQTDFTTVNEVIYNKISQGNYQFQLRAKKGEALSKPISLSIKVDGFFYNQWWFYLCLTLGIGATLFFYFKKQNIRLQERQTLELEKQNKELENIFLKLENLRSQMNPHFVFNALNSIQDYILNNQKNLAGDYLGKFADLIRKYLDQSTQKEIVLQEEIDTLESYLELEKLRFEDKLNYKISVAKNINTDAIQIPTILIQPYVENALKHGLLHKKETGNVCVDFTLDEEKNELNVIVKDDGIGRKKASEIHKMRQKTHKSFATKATKARLDLLNYNRTESITIETEEAYPDKKYVGTKVKIKIPIV